MVEGFKNTEVGLIPNDWEVKQLLENTSLMTNGFVGVSKLHYTDYENGILYIQGYNVEENGFNLHGIKRITNEFHNQHLKSCLREGDLLTIQTGDIGVTTVVPQKLEGSNCHALIITRFKKGIADPLFYSYYFNFSEGRKRLKEIETGSTMKHINVGDMRYLLIPYPSKSEQTAIATALNDADALITQLEKLIAKKKAIKQVISSDLLSGRIRLGDNTKKWEEETIESLCKIFTKQTGFDYSAYIKPSLITTYEEGVLPFIQNKDFYGRKINLNTDYFIPYIVAKNFPRILLDEKCLLISISGSVGHVGVFNEKRHAFLGGAIAVAKFIDKSKIDWAMYFLQSPLGQSMLLAKVKTGSHQNLILDDIRKMIIPYPPKDEMNQIISILFDIDLEIEKLETKLEKQKQLKQGMMQSLLTGKIRLV